MSKVKRILLCCACPWKGSCKENVYEAHSAASYPCLWKQEHKGAVPGAQSAVRSTVDQVQCVPKMYSCSRICRSTFPQPWFRGISLGVPREIVAQNSTFMQTRINPNFTLKLNLLLNFNVAFILVFTLSSLW